MHAAQQHVLPCKLLFNPSLALLNQLIKPLQIETSNKALAVQHAHLICTSWSPRPRPRGSTTPLPRMRSTSPFCVKAGTVSCAMPSMVGTETDLDGAHEHGGQQANACFGLMHT